MNPDILIREDLSDLEKLLWHWLTDLGQVTTTAEAAKAFNKNIWSMRKAVANLVEKQLIFQTSIYARLTCISARLESKSALLTSLSAPLASDNARQTSKNAPGVLAPVNGRRETPRGRANHGTINTINTRNHKTISNHNNHGTKHVGDLISQVLANIPNHAQQRAKLIALLREWIHDPKTHSKIFSLVADEIMMGNIDQNEVEKVIKQINQSDDLGKVDSRGGLFVHKIKMLFKKHDLPFPLGTQNTTR